MGVRFACSIVPTTHILRRNVIKDGLVSVRMCGIGNACPILRGGDGVSVFERHADSPVRRQGRIVDRELRRHLEAHRAKATTTSASRRREDSRLGINGKACADLNATENGCGSNRQGVGATSTTSGVVRLLMSRWVFSFALHRLVPVHRNRSSGFTYHLDGDLVVVQVPGETLDDVLDIVVVVYEYDRDGKAA